MRTRALAVLTAALLLVGATAGVAGAREVALRDPAGDMWRMDFAGDTEQAPDTRVGDVRRAVFRHGRSNIVIRQNYVDLRRVGEYTLYLARIQSGSKTYREVQVEAGPHSWRGAVKVFNRRGDRVSCDATHRIDYENNTLVMTVPRSCLRTPRMVRATASSSWAHRRRHVFLMDNPHNERSAANTWTGWLRSS